MLSDKQHAPADIVEDHGQVAVALADGDLVDRQKAQPIELGLAVVLFQIMFVDGLDRLPVQSQMASHFGYGHRSAQLVNVAGQPGGHPQIGMKQL